MNSMGICGVASASQRSWSASLITRRLAMLPPYDHTICLPW
jgi:hypothetical protein